VEDEIDLRPYVEALIKNWKWLVGAAVLAAVVAFVASSLLPPTYEATALVAVTQPGQLVQFDPRFEAVAENQPLRAYPELATSDEILQELLDSVAPIAPEVDSLEMVRRITAASAGADPSILRLTVTYRDPQITADVANQWADLFVVRANEVFGNLSGDQLAYFESQQASAAQELAQAEQALIDFQVRNRAGTIGNQLTALQEIQADYLANKQRLVFLVGDVQALRDQLDRNSAAEAISLADQLTALLLQLKAFGADETTPLQLQVDTAVSLPLADSADQITFLDNLRETLTARIETIDAELALLEPQILTLQQQKQEIDTESNQLDRNYTVAEETYTALARKVEEERITSQDTSSGVRLASKTAVPDEPLTSHRLLYSIIAGFVGIVVCVFFIFINQWWHEGHRGHS